MIIKHPTKKAVREWIIKVMIDDPYLSVLVDLAFSRGEHGSKSQRAWDRASDSPEAIEQIDTPWGPMTRWFAASTIVKDWSKVWIRR